MGDQLNQQTITLPQEFTGEVARAQEAWIANGNSRRLWIGDATLWTGHDESDWLGWLDIAGNKACDIDATREFARQLRPENFTDVLLLGMGGSNSVPKYWRRAWDRRRTIQSCVSSIPLIRSRCGVSKAALILRGRCSWSPASRARRSRRAS